MSQVSQPIDGQNKKLSARLNQIAQEAKGKYLARMDADDLMHPDRIEKQLAWLCENKDIAGTATPMLAIDMDNHLLGKYLYGDGPTSAIAEDIFNNRTPAHATILALTTWFRNNPYVDFGRAQDHAFWCESFLRNDLRIVTLEDPLYFYRRGGNTHLSHYLQGCSAQRKILYRYGNQLVGRPATWKKITRGYMKSMILVGVFTLRLQECLVSRLVVLLDNTKQSEMENTINRILSTKVSGFV